MESREEALGRVFLSIFESLFLKRVLKDGSLNPADGHRRGEEGRNGSIKKNMQCLRGEVHPIYWGFAHLVR